MRGSESSPSAASSEASSPSAATPALDIASFDETIDSYVSGYIIEVLEQLDSKLDPARQDPTLNSLYDYIQSNHQPSVEYLNCLSTCGFLVLCDSLKRIIAADASTIHSRMVARHILSTSGRHILSSSSKPAAAKHDNWRDIVLEAAGEM